MKFAILGADTITLALAKTAVDCADLEIVFLAELDSAAYRDIAELQRTVARSAQQLDSWEGLLDRRIVDGVIVARGVDEERRSEQLRKFTQVGVPVLFSHPVVDSMLLYYELDMIRRDTGALILPALADRLHPAMGELMSQITSSQPPPIGKIEQVAIERRLADRRKAAVRVQFTRDADLLRYLCGELNQIGAMGTAGDENAYGNLSVQMTGPNGLLARWSVVSPEDQVSGTAQLTLTGANGRASLNMPSHWDGWTLSAPGLQEPRRFENWNGDAVLLDKFVNAIEDKPVDSGTADLLDAARSAELTETIGRSLTRRRTIELHFEDRSEENTFKGTMAAGGCLLLMLGMGMLLLVAILDKARIPGMWLWPWVLAAAFGAFLAMQLLTLVFRK